MQYRSDLALEALEEERAQEAVGEQDVHKEERQEGQARLTRIVIGSERGERLLGKPMGTYITVEVPPLSDNEEHLVEQARLIGAQLAGLLPTQGTVLVVGLGNQHITPDALGPQAVDMVLATRHIGGEFARSTGLDDLRPAAVMAPGVLGQTGVESGEIVRGVCTVVQPAAVIAVDALAARSLTRLGCTVQLSDTGIAPGSGVGNNRQGLNRDTLGVPVIGMGVPTVVDAGTLVQELTGGGDPPTEITPHGTQMMVTPREIDLIIHRASRLVAMAINCALQPGYSPLDLIAVAG